MKKVIRDNSLKKLFVKLPSKPGVYKFYDENREFLYIGKAVDIKKRVRQHFDKPHNLLVDGMLAKVARVDFEVTDTVIEALILESNLIQAHQPYYNTRAKDDKSFLGVYITNENFSRVIPARLTAKRLPKGEFFGPYTSALNVRQALKILRKIFKWCNQFPKAGRACLYYHIGQCSGPCAGKIKAQEYRKSMNGLKLFLRGKKKELVKQLSRDMRQATRYKKFEEAARYRDQLIALQHIRDVALVLRNELSVPNSQFPNRIEGYDVSNISGTSAVASMVVFTNGKPDSSHYRKFRIKSVVGIDDVGMMIEAIRRRLKHLEWDRPNLIIIDGGVGHYNAVKKLVGSIPLLAIAKGPTRKKSDLILDQLVTRNPKLSELDLTLLSTQVRDEAHRFAINYHRQLRRKLTLPK